MSTGKVKKRAVIDKSHCVACGCCVKACPLGALSVRFGVYAHVEYDRCVGCGKCAKESPASVIEIKQEE